MNEIALERARRLVAEARNGRPDDAVTEALLERSRTQIEDLERAATELVATLPERVGQAVQEGFRREVLPVGRNLAEIRGLLNQANRRLERLEEALIAERHARLDDTALVVDLVSSGWRNVDERLRRVETRLGAEHVPLHGEVEARREVLIGAAQL
ncbi:MAG: hypothetical protein ACKVUT_01755 [Gaiella sp.]